MKKENNYQSNLQGPGRKKLQSVICFISLVTCSGLGRGSGDVSSSVSGKQDDSYGLFQILTKTTL